MSVLVRAIAVLVGLAAVFACSGRTDDGATSPSEAQRPADAAAPPAAQANAPLDLDALMRAFEEAEAARLEPREGEPAQRRAPLDQGDVFGLSAAMARAEEQLDQATPQDLAARAPAFATTRARVQGAKYLERILKPKSHERPNPQLALDAAERALLEKQGFVVSQRLGALSHAALMHTIYEHDQPLFVSADAVLHAWHMGYDAMLEELESTWITDALDLVLAGMAARTGEARQAARGAALEDAVVDADLFIAVARSLLSGELVRPTVASTSEVERLLKAILAEERANVTLFGRERQEDFSHMRPRGHYDRSDVLRRYFRAMVWLGRTELEVAGADGAPRELAAAIVLHDLLVSSGTLEQWRQIDRLIQTFVGRSDSMTPPDVGALLAMGGYASAREVKTAADLDKLTMLVRDTKLGAQQINSQLRHSDPNAPERVELPRAFCFMGQRFTVDSWVLGQLVFDRIVVDGKKVERTIPSGVDVAFAAFGNDNVVDLLADRIEHGTVKRRDGLPFQKNLLAARQVVDARSPDEWDGTLYDVWLSALRGLSQPTVGKEFPSVMRSRAWSRRVLQGQLASWAELRHDTILYVKQSHGMGAVCEYPTGFVELAPRFWERMERGTKLASKLIQETPYPAKLEGTKRHQLEYFEHFHQTVTTLRAIAARELAATPLSASQERFLKGAVEIARSGVCGAPPQWDGWYIKLFYRGQKEALKFDALVADVHTSPDDGVLHVGTGVAALMVVVIDRGGDTMAFAGPVSSYYETMPPGGKRLTDREWKAALAAGENPPPPEWTEGWFVPGKPRYLEIAHD